MINVRIFMTTQDHFYEYHNEDHYIFNEYPYIQILTWAGLVLTLTPTRRDAVMSGEVCRFFLQGKCRFGERCRYLHTRGDFSGRGYGGGGGGGRGRGYNQHTSKLPISMAANTCISRLLHVYTDSSFSDSREYDHRVSILMQIYHVLHIPIYIGRGK